MILHTVAKSPHDNPAMSSYLRASTTGAIVLLIEEGVYAAVHHSEYSRQLLKHSGRVYALSADVRARGLSERIDPRIELISDADFVRLSTECDSTLNWY